MKELIQRLEIALLQRNRYLAENLQPGLSAESIRKDLKKAGVSGAIEPLVELYAWRNGANLHDQSPAFKAAFEAGFVPPKLVPLTEGQKAFLRQYGVNRETDKIPFHFLPLKTAVAYWKDYVSAAKKQPALAALTARYFPILWDRSSGYVALDTDLESGNRVVLLQTSPAKDPHPVRQAYDSFEEFLKDAILANETNELLACLKNQKEPAGEPPAPQAAPGQAAVNTAAVAGANSAHEKTIVLRTDFSNEAAWKSIRATLQNLYKEVDNTLDFMDDRAHDGLPIEKISSVFSDSWPSFALVIDSTTLTKTDHPILVVSFQNKPAQTFRVIPSALKDVENNLSTANMDFGEFANAVDKDGVFRGFRQT